MRRLSRRCDTIRAEHPYRCRGLTLAANGVSTALAEHKAGAVSVSIAGIPSSFRRTLAVLGNHVSLGFDDAYAGNHDVLDRLIHWPGRNSSDGIDNRARIVVGNFTKNRVVAVEPVGVCHRNEEL